MKFEKVQGSANHHLFKLNGKYWVRFFKAQKSKELCKSLKTNELSTARIRRDEEIAKYLGEKPKYLGKVFLFEEMADQFVELKKIKSKGTYEDIKSKFELHLKPYFGGMLVQDVTETEWLKYVADKRQTHPELKFFNHRKYLSMFLHWLHRAGTISKLPKLPDVDPEIAEGVVYSKEQIKALIKNASFDLKTQIYCGVTMGMRVGEILSLEWSQIDFRKKTIYLPAAKTKIRKERTFGISPKAFIYLKRLKKASKGSAVFPSPDDPNKTRVKGGNKRSWATCKRAAGIPANFRFHWLRHTFLTQAFKKAVNPALICEYAGLSLEEAQKTYLHFTVEDTRVVSGLVRF